MPSNIVDSSTESHLCGIYGSLPHCPGSSGRLPAIIGATGHRRVGRCRRHKCQDNESLNWQHLTPCNQKQTVLKPEQAQDEAIYRRKSLERSSTGCTGCWLSPCKNIERHIKLTFPKLAYTQAFYLQVSSNTKQKKVMRTYRVSESWSKFFRARNQRTIGSRLFGTTTSATKIAVAANSDSDSVYSTSTTKVGKSL
jgi:hypothetical protein